MITFIDKKDGFDKDKYKELLLDKYIELKDFFGVEPAEKIVIEYIYSRGRMDQLWGDKTKISAMVDNHNPYKIYIYHPSVFETFTDKKLDEIIPILTHEVAHTFVTEINHRCFAWMNEGICEYVLDTDLYDNKFNKVDWDWFVKNGVFLDPKRSWSKLLLRSGYEISFNLVKYIIEKFGKQKFFKLLAVYRDDDRTDYDSVFSVILGIGFNDVLEDLENISILTSG